MLTTDLLCFHATWTRTDLSTDLCQTESGLDVAFWIQVTSKLNRDPNDQRSYLHQARLVLNWDGRPCLGSIPGARHLFQYVYSQPPKANSAFRRSGVGKWVPALKAKAGVVHSISRCTRRGVQIKLWEPLRTHALPERFGGVFATRRYTNPRLPLLKIRLC